MISGIGTSGGIGIGNALIIPDKNANINITSIDNPKEEKDRYDKVKAHFIIETEKLILKLKNKLKDNDKVALVLKNQIYLVNDEELNKSIYDIIENEHLCAEAAVLKACDMYINILNSIDSDVINQRIVDIKDLSSRIINMLQGQEELNLSELPNDTVIVANELHPSITAAMDTEHVAGIVARRGGENSHAAILSRALEIPAVLSVKNAMTDIKNNDLVIIDGSSGKIYINPDKNIIEEYREKREEYKLKLKELKEFNGKPTVTRDNKILKLFANIGTDYDAHKAVGKSAEGIGLFRTEFLFMNRISIPDEDEQTEAYKRAVIMCDGKPVTIRTLDIGGDKDIAYMGLEHEENPYLGYRAIRYCLDHKDLFETQLRSILKASAYGNVRIMLPMITCIEEIREVKNIIAYIKNEFDKNGIEYDKNIKIGIMIETPAAAVMADVFAKEVDFFSIGTNDLTQYTMAADRGNENVAYLYSVFNPAVLRTIENVINAAKNNNIGICMCGESAGNPLMIPLLIAFGLEEFSVSPSMILETRKNISKWTYEEACNVKNAVMNMVTKSEITAYLKECGGRYGTDI